VNISIGNINLGNKKVPRIERLYAGYLDISEMILECKFIAIYINGTMMK
jgi:hypothetical protein